MGSTDTRNRNLESLSSSTQLTTLLLTRYGSLDVGLLASTKMLLEVVGWQLGRLVGKAGKVK